MEIIDKKEFTDAIKAAYPEKKENLNIKQIEEDINPSHYKSVAIECIDAMRAAMGDDAVLAFCRGNALKYLWRMGKKDGNTAEMDAAKAQWYINKYLELSANKTEQNND